MKLNWEWHQSAAKFKTRAFIAIFLVSAVKILPIHTMHLPPSLFSKICCSIVQLVPEKSQDYNFDKETHLDWPHWACAVAASSKGNESSNSWDIEKALKYWRKIRNCHILHLIHISYMMISSIWLIDDWYHVSLDEKNHWRSLIPSLPEAWPEQEVCMPGLPSMIPIPYNSTSKGYEYQVYSVVWIWSVWFSCKISCLLYFLAPPKSSFWVFSVSHRFTRASRRSQEREAPLHPTRAARPATAERTNGRLAQRNSVTKEWWVKYGKRIRLRNVFGKSQILRCANIKKAWCASLKTPNAFSLEESWCVAPVSDSDNSDNLNTEKSAPKKLCKLPAVFRCFQFGTLWALWRSLEVSGS